MATENNIYTVTETDADRNAYKNSDNKAHTISTWDLISDGDQGTQPTGSESQRKQPYRWATVCLGLLCVFLLTALIVLSVNYKSSDGLHTKHEALKAERDQLWTNLSSVVADRDQLQTSYYTAVKERDQLQASNREMTTEKNQLETNYRNCSVSKEQLEKQVCPERWNSFKFSCYYISNEKKNWDDSRQYCKNRGADLVIINSKEEQAFIDHFQGRFWIGLSDKEREGTWKWVDGTIMPQYEGTWCSDQPDNFERSEDCVETRLMEPEPNKRWNDLSCDSVLRWICEKKSQ